MGSPKFENVEVLPQTEEHPSAAIIFLHGRGFSAENTKALFVNFLGGAGHLYIKMYFPDAPTKYLTVEDRVVSNWFDVVSTGPKLEDVEGNIDDADNVSIMIENKIKEIGEEDRIPPERVVIGGHSQGGMVCTYAAFVRGVKCGAVVTIAGHFPFSKKELIEGSSVPLLSIHGLKDIVVRTEIMNIFWSFLRANKIKFHTIALDRETHKLTAGIALAMFRWMEKKYHPLNNL